MWFFVIVFLCQLEESEFGFGGIAEVFERPWRIEGEFDVDAFDAFDIGYHIFNFAEHVFGFRTVGCRHGHKDFDVELVVDVDVVDQSEIVDVDRNLRVVNVLEAIDYCAVDGFFCW